MTDLLTLSDESILANHAANTFHSAHGGHPNGLNTTIGKLRQAGRNEVADYLYATIVAADPLWQRLYALSNTILTANGQPANTLDDGGWMTPAQLDIRISRVGVTTPPPFRSFGMSAMVDDAVISEPNAGAETVRVNGGFPLYAAKNTRILKWNYVLKQKNRPSFTLVVWNGGSGPFVSSLHACILNLQTLAGRDNVADKPALADEVNGILYDVLEYQAAIWSVADAVKSLGDASFSESVPADVKKRYPGYATLHYADGSSRRV